MKIAYAGFDLMYRALDTLKEDNEIIKLFTCRVDGISESNEKVIGIAEDKGIPYTSEKIRQSDIDELVGMGCELLVSAGYYYRIPVDRRLAMVNIHPSLLPYGRGAWPMPLAILDRLPESGVTVHKTEEGFDTGDILLQKRFDLEKDETLDTFMDKVNALLPLMMRELTGDFDRLYRHARPQGEGVYLEEPDNGEYILTPHSDSAYADRVLRAFSGFPVIYRGEKGEISILRGRAVQGAPEREGLPLKDGYIKISSKL